MIEQNAEPPAGPRTSPSGAPTPPAGPRTSPSSAPTPPAGPRTLVSPPAFPSVSRLPGPDARSEAPSATRDGAASAPQHPSRTALDPGWLLLNADALQAARMLRPSSVDLIYADPPFFTGRARTLDRRTAVPGYEDRWPRGRGHYIGWLVERIAALRTLLKPGGSLFLHLDWHAVHAAKVALDDVFGEHLFVNEIIWAYRTGGAGKRRLARKHDTLLFYANSPGYKFHPLRERSDLAHRYGFANAGVQVDARGAFRMTLLRDVWEIPALRGNHPERVPFPTQKPLALLRRVVALVTDPGDLVLDPFCGSGTTLVAALESGRRAIGVDTSRPALDLARARLLQAQRGEPVPPESAPADVPAPSDCAPDDVPAPSDCAPGDAPAPSDCVRTD